MCRVGGVEKRDTLCKSESGPSHSVVECVGGLATVSLDVRVLRRDGSGWGFGCGCGTRSASWSNGGIGLLSDRTPKWPAGGVVKAATNHSVNAHEHNGDSECPTCGGQAAQRGVRHAACGVRADRFKGHWYLAIHLGSKDPSVNVCECIFARFQ